MAKPATVEKDKCTSKTTKSSQHLHLVKEASRTGKGDKATAKSGKPEIADDLDDMWDNVPV